MATIKAGTYRFNDVLTAPSGALEQSISFSVADVDYEVTQEMADQFAQAGITVPVGSFTASGSFGGIRTSDPNEYDYFVVNYTGGVFRADDDRYSALVQAVLSDGDKEVYNTTSGYNWDVGSVPNPQTITIPNDTEVSAEFAEWFTANAIEQKQISGKWKFNDVLSYAGAKTEYVNFTASVPVADMVIVGQCDCIAYGYNLSINVVSSDPDISAMGFPLPLALSVYDPEADIPWEYDLNYIDFGTEPQTVSAEFYNWLTDNATQPMASVSHNGEEIASLFPGQTATLKCAGMKMAGDVVVAVAEQTAKADPVLQTLEVNITEPGIFEFVPDAGYDGIFKVVVGVDAPQLTAPTISLNGNTLTLKATDENTESFAIFVDGVEMATAKNG